MMHHSVGGSPATDLQLYCLFQIKTGCVHVRHVRLKIGLIFCCHIILCAQVQQTNEMSRPYYLLEVRVYQFVGPYQLFSKSYSQQGKGDN